MIELRGVTKRYGDKTAVNNLSFTVKPGIVTGFLGPNGAGKSTTMRMIAGLDAPSSGTVLVNGRPYRSSRAPMAELGTLLEAKALHTSRTAFHHLLALAQTNGIPKSRVTDVINLVGLSDVARKRAGGFSLGMGQRLGIASALLGDPQTIILDEPINGLDPEGILWVRNLLKSLAAEGRTVFISSHLMSEMSQTAQHLVVIGRGELIADVDEAAFVAMASSNAVLVRSPHASRLRELLAGRDVTINSPEDGTKLRSLRSTLVTLGAAVVLTVGFGALASGVVASQWATDPGSRAGFHALDTSLTGILVAQLAAGVLGVLLLSGEYATGMIRASLTAVPKRLPVLWAKLLVFTGVVGGVSIAAAFAAFLTGQALLSTAHIQVSITSPHAVRMVVGAGVYMTLVGIIGMGLAGLLRNTAAAISGLVATIFVIPPLMFLLPSSVADQIGPYLPSNAGQAFWTHDSGAHLHALAGFAVLCAWAAAAVAAAALRMRRSDA